MVIQVTAITPETKPISSPNEQLSDNDKIIQTGDKFQVKEASANYPAERQTDGTYKYTDGNDIECTYNTETGKTIAVIQDETGKICQAEKQSDGTFEYTDEKG